MNPDCLNDKTKGRRYHSSEPLICDDKDDNRIIIALVGCGYNCAEMSRAIEMAGLGASIENLGEAFKSIAMPSELLRLQLSSINFDEIEPLPISSMYKARGRKGKGRHKKDAY